MKLCFLGLFCVFGFLGKLGRLVDIRLDFQKKPLYIFMVLAALFKVGGMKGVLWPTVTQALISRPNCGELGQPEASGGSGGI